MTKHLSRLENPQVASLVKTKMDALRYLQFANVCSPAAFRIFLFLLVMFSAFFISCKQKPLPNQYMIDLLREAKENDSNVNNVFSPGAILKNCDSVIDHSSDENVLTAALVKKGNALLQ